MAEPREFLKIGARFDSNLRTLRIFFEDIGEHAEAHDRKTIDRVTGLMDEAIGPELLDMFNRRREAGEQNGPGQDSRNSDPATDGEQELSPEMQEEVQKFTASPERIQKLLSALSSMAKEAPRQAHVLRCSALVNLASYLEWLIADLLHAYYERFPAALPDDGRTLSLSDLREIGSVEEAEKLIVGREVDSVLRGSIEDQLEYFSKRLKIHPPSLSPYLQRLVEVSQRRNAIVHNAGRFGSAYFRKVDTEVAERHGAKFGEEVRVPRAYFRDAWDSVLIAGAALVQTCWRSWDKDSASRADDHMIDLIYSSLCEERYELVEKLGVLSSQIGFADDVSARIVAINRAIALKQLDRPQAMEDALRCHDWSASAIRFRVALHVLRDEFEEVYKELPKAVASEEITRENLEEWPLFQPLRDSERYRQFLDQHFGNTLNGADGKGCSEPAKG